MKKKIKITQLQSIISQVFMDIQELNPEYPVKLPDVNKVVKKYTSEKMLDKATKDYNWGMCYDFLLNLSSEERVPFNKFLKKIISINNK